MKRLARLFLVLGVGLAAVGSGAAGPGESSTLTIYAASSLADVFPQIDGRSRYSFGGSDTLAVQIRQGAPADVFAAASPKAPDALYREGLVRRPVVFATNRLVLVVPRANPARIHSVFDLRRRGVKLVIAQAGVPAGDYTREVLRRLGLSSVLGNVVSEETDVRNVVGKVALGEADAGFVYATDARSAGGRLASIAIPARAQPRVRYELAVVVATRNGAAAQAFVRRVLGPTGRARLKAAGFGLP